MPKLLAVGTSRKVYDMGNGTVVKCFYRGSLSDGIRANMDEITTYQELNENSNPKNYIVKPAKIISFCKNGLWIKMKKYNNENTQDINDYFSKLSDIIPVLDCNSANLGKDKQGNYVLLDYERLNWTWLDKNENPYYKEELIE